MLGTNSDIIKGDSDMSREFYCNMKIGFKLVADNIKVFY